MDKICELSSVDLDKVSGGDLYNPHYNESLPGLLRELQDQVGSPSMPSLQPIILVP